jgi:hypothetical protein
MARAGVPLPEDTSSARTDIEFRRGLIGLESLVSDIFPRGMKPQLPTLPPDTVPLSSSYLSDVKKALSRPLESCSTSLTASGAMSTPHRSPQQMQTDMSFFLLRKLLPSPDSARDPSATLAAFASRPTANSSFLHTVSCEIPEIFKPGWDDHYEQYVERIALGRSACTENSRKKGGTRSFITSTFTLQQLIRLILDNPTDIPDERNLVVLDDGGKTRKVTIASALQCQLLPLHCLLYDTLSHTRWLLRGDPTPNLLTKCGFTTATTSSGESEVFVSGDYEAATDNLSSLHSRAILSAIFDSARNSSLLNLREVAIASLTGQVSYKGTTSPQSNSQLMGNFLSFPLLCLTNFLAWRHSLRFLPRSVLNRIPLLINGDDIVFRVPLWIALRWCRDVSASGFILSLGKTLLRPEYFTINSALFRATPRRALALPIVRAKTIWSNCLSPAALLSRLPAAAKHFHGERRIAVTSTLLKQHRRIAMLVRGSYGRANGVLLSRPSLSKASLLARELWCLTTTPAYDRWVPQTIGIPKPIAECRVPESRINPPLLAYLRHVSQRVSTRNAFVEPFPEPDLRASIPLPHTPGTSLWADRMSIFHRRQPPAPAPTPKPRTARPEEPPSILGKRAAPEEFDHLTHCECPACEDHYSPWVTVPASSTRHRLFRSVGLTSESYHASERDLRRRLGVPSIFNRYSTSLPPRPADPPTLCLPALHPTSYLTPLQTYTDPSLFRSMFVSAAQHASLVPGSL